MKKRILIFFTLASLFSKAFSLDIINEIRQSINKIIPSNHTIIDVSIPKYNETEAASEFSKYLEKRIYASLSEIQKSVFSFTTKNKMEEFEAQLSDTGDYESIMNEAAYASKPNGRLFTEFEEIGNTIEIALKYEPLGRTSIGTSQTGLIILHKKDLPFFTYKPENFEQEKEKYSDVKTAKEIIVKSTGSSKSIEITAFMIDENEKKAEIFYPGETAKFLIAVDRASYISIQGIDAEGFVFWLPIKNNFMEADVPRKFPDNDQIDYKVLDGVFGAERIYIYASSTPEGLPTQTQNTKYRPNMLSDAARGLISVTKQKVKDAALGVFCITYTILPGKREEERNN